MATPVTLTFPVGFDPMGLSNQEVADTVRRLWLEAANRDLAAAVADLAPEDFGPGGEPLADTVPLTEGDLTLFLDPDPPAEPEYCNGCYGQSARDGVPFTCPTCKGRLQRR